MASHYGFEGQSLPFSADSVIDALQEDGTRPPIEFSHSTSPYTVSWYDVSQPYHHVMAIDQGFYNFVVYKLHRHIQN